MPNIPYHFETPVPSYFRENGWFDSEHMFKFITWAFSRCQTVQHTQTINGKEITLQPFEFVAGRLSSPAECFLSENVFRYQINQLINQHFLKKSTNSLTNRYTCYIWSTERFCKNNNQPNNQPNFKKQPTESPQIRSSLVEVVHFPAVQHNVHNPTQPEVYQTKAPSYQTLAPSVGLVSAAAFFDCLKEIALSDEDKGRLMEFSEATVANAVKVLNERKKPPDSLMAYLLTACREGYVPREKKKSEIPQKANPEQLNIVKELIEKMKVFNIPVSESTIHSLVKKYGTSFVTKQLVEFAKERHEPGGRDKSAIFTTQCKNMYELFQSKQKTGS